MRTLLALLVTLAVTACSFDKPVDDIDASPRPDGMHADVDANTDPIDAMSTIDAAPTDANDCPLYEDTTGSATCISCFEEPSSQAPGCTQCRTKRDGNLTLVYQGECCNFDCCHSTTGSTPWPSCS